jgi:hypothetical protein
VRDASSTDDAQALLGLISAGEAGRADATGMLALNR